MKTKKIAILCLVAISFSFYSYKSNFFEVAKQIEIYNSLFKELNMYYVDEINPADLTDRVIKNTLKDLDPYTNFYNEQDVEDAKIRREGQYGGIGVSVYYTEKGVQIKEIYKGFAADKAGLKPGDIVISVDNQSLKNMERAQLSMFLKGAPNSKFIAEVERQGKILRKEIIREKIEVNAVPFSKMIDDEVGYIVLTRFNSKASFEVKKAFKALKNKGMKKLIFDLRSNPGGSLREAINIANFFVEKGKTIVTTKAKIKKWSTTYKGSNNPLDLKIPIVILINGRSASASEIVAGSLQDYDRAVIMGERSFGKGLVQRQKELTYGTQLKLTISKYYTPSGRCIQELDYTNRDGKTGKVPKFSDRGINEFKTKNGRLVYDGGGILPDIKTNEIEKSKMTANLLDSKTIFNFAINFYYKNTGINSLETFQLPKNIMNQFSKYLEQDTLFVTAQEKLFKEAYWSSKNASISKEYEKIKKVLAQEKIETVLKNKQIVYKKIEDEILLKYFYKDEVYQYNIKEDPTILQAVILLKNQGKYNKILSGK